MHIQCILQITRQSTINLKAGGGGVRWSPSSLTTNNNFNLICVYVVGEGACQHDVFNISRLSCELSYGTCPISLWALQPLLFKLSGAIAKFLPLHH